ncbi:MAG: hypothetical protein IT383_10580 [Deltaproteobacteria bacterium]|nr:hypothetical protein [Deltaproteobacteria bacterium]
MPFQPLLERFRDVAINETRAVAVAGDPSLPDGRYLFTELFCNEADCDCRRALLHVLRSDDVSAGSYAPLATLSFGWEDERFYREWASFPLTDEDLRELKGPALQRLTQQSRLAPALLRVFETAVVDDEYVERLARHYKLFRTAIEGRRRLRVAAMNTKRIRKR